MDIAEKLEKLAEFFRRLEEYASASINIDNKTYVVWCEEDGYRLLESKERAYICIDTYGNKDEVALVLLEFMCREVE